MEKVSKKQNFTSKVYNIEKVNPFFSKVKIYVLYEGINRNGSYLNRNAINKAIPTIYNVPIVGEFLADVKNFGNHGANVVQNDNGEYEVILSTRPYGVVPESAQIYWESVKEDDGTEREYLVVDGAYLWTGRYPELHTFLDEGYYGQSMEIEVANGSYSIIEGQEVFNIQDFIFTAFCLLGIDKDSDMFGHEEPCFEKSKVELVTYSLDKDSFKTQFNQMIDELKFTLTGGGSKTMENENTQFVEGADVQNDLKKRLDGVSATDAEATEVTPEPEVKPETEEDTQTGSEGSEGSDVAQKAVKAETEPTTPETETPVVEGADAVTEVAHEGDATDGGEVAVEGDAGTFTVSVEEHNALKANFEALETEVSELRTYKRNRELGDLKAKFSHQVSEQELTQLFEANSEATIEKLEVEIFALIGKKNYSLDNKPKQNKVSVVSPKVANEESSNPYGDIFN
ncbi:hypothetical protein ACIQ1D_19445 [Lysinibacillus xylanilyticus]|uniref:hypothetical protein n=1 Tax=Lysinibacillus xylanilyticus TaxID=582475 RepID=UPI0038090F8E